MRMLHGVIVSNKMRRTATVRVDRLSRHPKYRKYERRSRIFKADTGLGDWRAGDEVVIQETRPLSKEKRWKIVQLIKRNEAVPNESEDEILGS